VIGLGGLDEPKIPAVLVMEAAGHSAAELQPVLLELPHAYPFRLPGRAVCPALGTGDGGHRGMPREHQRQATEPTKSAMYQVAGSWPARVPGWLVERLRLGVGHASTVRPDPSTLGAVGERGSRHEGRSPARSRPPRDESCDGHLASGQLLEDLVHSLRLVMRL
jgi:hypothetical protein